MLQEDGKDEMEIAVLGLGEEAEEGVGLWFCKIRVWMAFSTG